MRMEQALPFANKGTIIIYTRKVLDALDKKAYRFSRTLQEVDQMVKADIADICQDTNIEETLDNIGRAVAQLSQMMSAYVKTPAYPMEIDDNDERGIPDYKLVLNLPRGWQIGATLGIARFAQEYVVNKVLYDWVSDYLPEQASVFTVKYEDAYENIINIAKGRTKAVEVKATVL